MLFIMRTFDEETSPANNNKIIKSSISSTSTNPNET